MWILDCIRYQRRVDESEYRPQWMNSPEFLPTEPPVMAQSEDSDSHKLNELENANPTSEIPATAISVLLNRAHNDSLEFQYGESSNNGEYSMQPESEVIDEEVMEKEIWNERKSDHKPIDQEELVSPMKQIVTPGPPVFLLGGGSHSKYRSLEQDARDIISRLGGTILSPTLPYSSCTHLILWELKRTEKYLCCCVSGKVI